MMNYKLELKEMLPKSSKDFINFGRSLKAKYPKLYEEVESQTGFLPNCKFIERVYCLLNDITTAPICRITGKKLPFLGFNDGYASFHSSVKPTDFANYTPLAWSPITEEDKLALANLYNETDKHLLSNKLMGKFSHLINSIVGTTKHLNPCCFNERVFCVIHDTTRPDGYVWRAGSYVEMDVKKKQLQARDCKHEELSLKYFGVSDAMRGMLIESAIKKSANDKELQSYPETDEGIKFVKCPVLGIRMLSIKNTYMKSILKMTKEEFKVAFPNHRTYCDASKDRIKEGLQKVGEDGRTAHRRSVDSAIPTKRTPGADGLTPNQKIGINSKATHMSNIDEHGRNGYSQSAQLRNSTFVESGLTVQQNALLKARITRSQLGNSKTPNASRASKIALAPIIDWLTANDKKYYFDRNEFCVNLGKRCYFYDLVIPEIKMCVEYQSRTFHADPHMSIEDLIKFKILFSSDNGLERIYADWVKAKYLFENRGIRMWYCWESSVTEDVDNILRSIKGAYNEI